MLEEDRDRSLISIINFFFFSLRSKTSILDMDSLYLDSNIAFSWDIFLNFRLINFMLRIPENRFFFFKYQKYLVLCRYITNYGITKAPDLIVYE